MTPLQLNLQFSTVKLELDVPVLIAVFDALASNQRPDIIRRLLCQLKTE